MRDDRKFDASFIYLGGFRSLKSVLSNRNYMCF